MPLEAATYIADLNSANPAHSDQVNQADSHMRLIKAVLKSQFPNWTSAALASTNTQIDAAVTATGAAGILAVADGTALLPSHTFSSETNTGLYKSALHELSAAINGVQKVKFTASGLDILTAGSLLAGGTAVFPLATANIAAGAITNALLAASAVNYSNIQNVTNNRLLGNISGGAAAPEEIAIGSGLATSGTTLSAPGYAPPAAFKNLSIKVTTGSAATCNADYVTLTDGTNYRTVAVGSASLNLSITGLNGLDTGALGASSWYAVYAIAKADGSLPGYIASLSFTSPALPAGYTLYARIGALRTSGASQLYGTYQFGREVQYVVGLAQTTVQPTISSGVTAGWQAYSVSAMVPSTASAVKVSVYASHGDAAGAIGVAPNGSYGALGYGSWPSPMPPLLITHGSGASNQGKAYTLTSAIELETMNVYVNAGGGAGNTYCAGWVDNI